MNKFRFVGGFKRGTQMWGFLDKRAHNSVTWKLRLPKGMNWDQNTKHQKASHHSKFHQNQTSGYWVMSSFFQKSSHLHPPFIWHTLTYLFLPLDQHRLERPKSNCKAAEDFCLLYRQTEPGYCHKESGWWGHWRYWLKYQSRYKN